jgi:hypothetical protein
MPLSGEQHVEWIAELDHESSSLAAGAARRARLLNEGLPGAADGDIDKVRSSLCWDGPGDYLDITIAV